MIRIKFLSKAPAASPPVRFQNMFPSGVTIWGNCEFIFDPYERNYDWLVVYDDLPSKSGERFTLWEEELACARERSLLITSEPASVKAYGSGFVRQFGHVLTSQEPWALRHPKRIYKQPGLVWFYGEHGPGASFDFLNSHCPDQKSRDLSTVCSTKNQKGTLHNKRLEFTRKLKQHFPEMDVFGHGFNFVSDKAVALDAYRYHLVIENHYAPHHWTEKLADAFLGLCLPFYFGCPNLGEYFPEESYLVIDLFDYDASIALIEKAVLDCEYEKRLPAIKEARRLYLDRYFTFANISQHIERLDPHITATSGEDIIIRSRHAWRRKSWFNSLCFGLEKGYVMARSRNYIINAKK